MKEILRHYLNPMKLRAWLRNKGFSRTISKYIAVQYESIYKIAL